MHSEKHIPRGKARTPSRSPIMCKSDLHSLLCELPKCEHHLHIEGTLTPDLLFTLAKKNSISLPSENPAFSSPSSLLARYQNFTSLDDFLHYYFIGFSVLLTASDFEELTFAYLQQAYPQTLRHAEIFFDPQAHTSRGVPYETVVSGLNAAKMRAAVAFPDLTVAFIPCLVRHLPVSSASEMLAEVVSSGHFADGTVTGFGMSSTEIGMHPSLFTDVYDAAKKAGVDNLTAHVGEEGPSEYVSAAISHLGVVRIDHGRRAAEDVSLVRHLADNKVMLTLCPVSNVVLRGVDKVEDVPIKYFLDAGVRFSINSDDPAYFGAGLLENYCAVQEALDLTMGEWETIAKGAIEGSWCTEERKRELVTMVDTVFQTWQG